MAATDSDTASEREILFCLLLLGAGYRRSIAADLNPSLAGTGMTYWRKQGIPRPQTATSSRLVWARDERHQRRRLISQIQPALSRQLSAIISILSTLVGAPEAARVALVLVNLTLDLANSS